ncbi:hypothetical protein [Peijinzhouia sedimentorum]
MNIKVDWLFRQSTFVLELYDFSIASILTNLQLPKHLPFGNGTGSSLVGIVVYGYNKPGTGN